MHDVQDWGPLHLPGGRRTSMTVGTCVRCGESLFRGPQGSLLQWDSVRNRWVPAKECTVIPLHPIE